MLWLFQQWIKVRMSPGNIWPEFLIHSGKVIELLYLGSSDIRTYDSVVPILTSSWKLTIHLEYVTQQLTNCQETKWLLSLTINSVVSRVSTPLLAPALILKIISLEEPDWTSQDFGKLFSLTISNVLHMWLDLQKPSLMVHFVFREILHWNIEATVFPLCYAVAMPDLLYK